MTRRVLGRGLGALLSAESGSGNADESYEIEIELIDRSPLQPRTHFDEAKLAELASSIKANGVVQPLIVRKKGLRFELVAGERRWRAAQLAGLIKIPAIVRNIPDEKVLELALIENIQREDLNPIEEAQAYKKLIESVGLTQESLAERVGRDRSYITNYLRLLRLPGDIQQLLQEGKLSTGHARTLLGLDEDGLRRRLCRQIIDRGLSVRQAEQMVRRIADKDKQFSRDRTPHSEKDANVKAAEQKLRRALGTKVEITKGATGAGKIVIEYYNAGDLDRLYDLLLHRAQAAIG